MIRSRAVKELSAAPRSRGQCGERVESGKSDAESVERLGKQRLSDYS
jgi:hypothetical protein